MLKILINAYDTSFPISNCYKCLIIMNIPDPESYKYFGINEFSL